MSISSISYASYYTAVQTNNSSETSELESQKSNIIKQIEAENKSKDDAKTKQQKIQKLQAQLDQINAQIQQIKSQKPSQVSTKEVQSLKNIPENNSNKNTNSKVDSSPSNILDEYA